MPTTPPLSRGVLFRPRSIRGRVTVLVSLLAVLLLVPSGLVAGLVAHRAINDSVWLQARQEATSAAAADHLGRLTDPIKSGVPGIDLVQVVASNHRVVASSADAQGLPPLSTAWPTPQDPEQDVGTCAQRQLGCVHLSALRVTSAPDSPVVYAGRPAPADSSTRVIDSLFAAQGTILVLLAASTTWKVTGRTLRPVEAIRAELAAINGDDLGSRVPQPMGDDEIARLARTVNGTLERLENARDRMNRALIQQRQFAADASHELRTPVAGLRAQLEEAQLHPEETDLNDLLAHSLYDVDRLQTIIADLLLLTRLESSAPELRERIDLATIVGTEVSQRADPDRVRLRLTPDVPVHAIRSQIGRAITNLLDNAERHARRTVVIEVRQNGDSAELIVDDDGEGVAEADRQRIFERFTRLDAARSRDQGGTGLGLAIARGIAQAHDGTVEAGASPSGGGRFILRLPLAGPSDNGQAANDRST
ncbi:Signal transduction histidine kinase [Streptosporangium subroseum]|uniref:histidine kinase n=1 Tax=Streptosporangium subroseum TaxID=106412 RepID=A0A239A0K0_9ACTN|nr:Signal transduction histidine kinase [Streptosporangium subroseum]